MKPSTLHQTFRLSLWVKGLDGLLEIIGGFLFVLVKPATLGALASFLTQHELSQDPHDFLANHLLAAVHHLAGSTVWFTFIYLLSHGLVKLILVIALLKNRLWAYPWMIGFLGAFALYQLYRLSIRFTIGLTLLTVFDLIIIVLTWIEYRQLHHSYSQSS